MAEQRSRSTLIVGIILALIVIVVPLVIYSALHRPAPRTVTIAKPAKQPATRPNRGTPSWPAITYDDGAMWQLTGVHEYPDGPWWGGDGLPIPEPKAPTLRSFAPAATQRAMELRYRCVSKDAHGQSVRLSFPEGIGSAANQQSQSNTVRTGSAVFAVADDLDRIDLQVGVTEEQWKPQLRADIDAKTSPVRVTTQPTAAPVGVEFGEIRYENGVLSVELINNRSPEQRMQVYSELAMIKKTGKPVTSKRGRYVDGRTFYEFTVPVDQLAAIVYQTRDFKWLTMPAIPLRPKSPATTQSASAP